MIYKVRCRPMLASYSLAFLIVSSPAFAQEDENKDIENSILVNTKKTGSVLSTTGHMIDGVTAVNGVRGSGSAALLRTGGRIIKGAGAGKAFKEDGASGWATFRATAVVNAKLTTKAVGAINKLPLPGAAKAVAVGVTTVVVGIGGEAVYDAGASVAKSAVRKMFPKLETREKILSKQPVTEQGQEMGAERPSDHTEVKNTEPNTDFNSADVEPFSNSSGLGFEDPPRRTVYPKPPTNEFGERVESPDDIQVSRFSDQTPQGLIDPSRQSAYPMPPLGEAENQHSQAPNPRSQTVLQQSGGRIQNSGAPETILGSNSENYSPPNQSSSSCIDMYGRTVNYSAGSMRPCLKKLEKTEDGYVMHLQLTPGETRPFNIFEGSSPEMVCEAILAGPDRDNCMQYVQRIKPDVGYKDETNNFGAENSGSVDEASNLDAEKSDPDSDTSGKNQSPLRRDFPQCDPELTNQAVSRSGGVEECIREQKILEKQIGEGLDHYPECGPAPELPMISTFNAPNQNGGGDWRTSQALNKEPTTSSNSTSSLLANKLSNFKRRRTAIKECLRRAVRVCEEQKRKNEELRSACGIPAPYAPISWNDMSSIQRSNERAQEFERCYGFSKFEAECGKHPGEVRTHDINVLRRAYERQQSIMSCAREIMLREQQENEEDQCPKIPTDEEALRGFDTGNYVATADLAQQSSGSETQLGAETEKSSLNLPAEASQQDWIDPKVADKLFDTLLPQ